MLRPLILLILPLILLITPAAHANSQAVAIDYLQGSDDIKGVRLAYRPFTHHLVSDWFGEISLYWEASVNVWEYGAQNTHSSNVAFALSPVLMKRIGTVADSYPVYLEAGIGASLVNDREFAGKDIGSHYQFEDRLGLVMSLDEDDSAQVSVRYMHYSNAGLNDDNPGLDFLSLSYIHHF